MGIFIINVSDPPTLFGWNHYELRINQTVIARFRHRREDSLGTCLRRAADAADAAEFRRLAPLLGLVADSKDPGQ